MNYEKIVATHQPDFCPYAGFWYKMRHSHLFEIRNYDFLNTTRFMHRVMIDGNSDKTKWLTLPVSGSGKPIRDALLKYETNWQKRLIDQLKTCYDINDSNKWVIDGLQKHFDGHHETMAALNIDIIRWLKDILRINTELIVRNDAPIAKDTNDRLVETLLKYNTTIYLSGVGAKDYMDKSKFEAAGIRIRYSDFNSKNYQFSILHYLLKYDIEDVIEFINHGLLFRKRR